MYSLEKPRFPLNLSLNFPPLKIICVEKLFSCCVIDIAEFRPSPSTHPDTVLNIKGSSHRKALLSREVEDFVVGFPPS
jgi:hypothetical protein